MDLVLPRVEGKVSHVQCCRSQQFPFQISLRSLQITDMISTTSTSVKLIIPIQCNLEFLYIHIRLPTCPVSRANETLLKFFTN